VAPAAPKVLVNLAAGAAAGVCQVVATCPMEVMKQREMLGDKRNSDGIEGLFRGMTATWLRDIPFSAIYFATAFYLHTELLSKTNCNEALATMGAGLGAGFLASLVTTPADVIKVKVQCEAGKDGGYPSIGEVVTRVLREEGYGGFFAGVGARVCKIGPAMMINICVYESLKTIFGTA